MTLDLELQIVVVDVESTGVDSSKDEVIELAIRKGLTPDSPSKTWLFRPSIPIPPQATAVHGIADEDLRDCPSFAEHCDEIRDLLSNCDVLMGYNVHFDIDMLQAQLRRASRAEIDLSSVKIVDPLLIWRRCENRKLETALKRFSGEEHSGGHRALADVDATAAVFEGMRKVFGLQGASWQELADICAGKKGGGGSGLGPSEHIVWKEGVPYINFGKHRGLGLLELKNSNPGYLQWMSRSDFPSHVKAIVENLQSMEDSDFLSWVEKSFRE